MKHIRRRDFIARVGAAASGVVAFSCDDRRRAVELAREEIRCSHPERARCTQCHVEVVSTATFARTDR